MLVPAPESDRGIWYLTPATSIDVVVTVRCTVTIRGTGTNAPSSFRRELSVDHAFTVRAATLPIADAPRLVLTDLGSTNETDTPGLLVTPTGGVYDEIEYEWEIISGSGSLEIPHAVGPNLVIDEAVRPNMAIEDVTSELENKRVYLSVNGSGGVYDEIEFEWEILEGGGDLLADYMPATPARAPNININDITSITEQEYGHFSVNGSGGIYDEIEFEWEILSGGGDLLADYVSNTSARAPNININDITSITEAQYGHFVVNGSGGLYDEIELE